MSSRCLMFSGIAVLLFLLLQGCSFYAGIRAEQSPPLTSTKLATNIHQEGRGNNEYEMASNTALSSRATADGLQ